MGIWKHVHRWKFIGTSGHDHLIEEVLFACDRGCGEVRSVKP